MITALATSLIPSQPAHSDDPPNLMARELSDSAAGSGMGQTLPCDPVRPHDRFTPNEQIFQVVIGSAALCQQSTNSD
jgi:hypothetical protein